MRARGGVVVLAVTVVDEDVEAVSAVVGGAGVVGLLDWQPQTSVAATASTNSSCGRVRCRRRPGARAIAGPFWSIGLSPAGGALVVCRLRPIRPYPTS